MQNLKSLLSTKTGQPHEIFPNCPVSILLQPHIRKVGLPKKSSRAQSCPVVLNRAKNFYFLMFRT